MPTLAADAAHLARRAGFGASATRVAAMSARDWDDLVDGYLTAGPVPPDPYPGRDTNWNTLMAMVQAWLDRMAAGPTPLVEKMTLFWHGHLTSGFGKTYDPEWLWQQNQVLRANALGDLRTLLKQVAITPAMLDYLDNRHNRAGRPNENWARELMELFVLGAGTHSQDDVAAMARAWTGHGIRDRAYRFDPSRHDTGVKTILGVTRNWDGPDTIDLLLDGPQRTTAARFIATKVFAHLAHPAPSPATVDALAEAFAGSDWDIGALVRAVLTHPDFRSPAAREGLVRTPIEFAAAVLRCGGLTAAEANPQWWFGAMGQMPFDPPNVSGWRQNRYWLTTSAMGARYAFARYVTWKLNGDDGFLPDVNGAAPSAAVSSVCDRFEITPSAATRARLEAHVTSLRSAGHRWAVRPNLLTLVMMTPEFHLA